MSKGLFHWHKLDSNIFRLGNVKPSVGYNCKSYKKNSSKGTYSYTLWFLRYQLYISNYIVWFQIDLSVKIIQIFWIKVTWVWHNLWCILTVCLLICALPMLVQNFLLLIYLLTAIGLTPTDSSTVHIYTQTIHRTTQWNRIPRTEHT